MPALSKLAVAVMANVTMFVGNLTMPTPPGTTSPADAGTTNGGGILHFLYQNVHYLVGIVGSVIGFWHRAPLAVFVRNAFNRFAGYGRVHTDDAQQPSFKMNNLVEGGNSMHRNNTVVAGQEVVHHGARAAPPQFPPPVFIQRPMSPPLRREHRGLEIMETIDEADEDVENRGNDDFVEATLDLGGYNIGFGGGVF